MIISSCLTYIKNCYESIGLNSIERDKAQNLIDLIKSGRLSRLQMQRSHLLDTKELYFLDKTQAHIIDRNFIKRCLEKAKTNVQNNRSYDNIDQSFYSNKTFDYFFFQRVFSRQCNSILEELRNNGNSSFIESLDEEVNKIFNKVLKNLEIAFMKDSRENRGLDNFVYSQHLENKLLKSSTKIVGIVSVCVGLIIFYLNKK